MGGRSSSRKQEMGCSTITRYHLNCCSLTSSSQCAPAFAKYFISVSFDSQTRKKGIGISNSTPSSRRRSLPLRRRPRTRAHSDLLRFLSNLGRMTSSRRALPVIHHLPSQNSIEQAASHKHIQDQLIVHLLQRRKHPRQRSQQISKDLSSVPTLISPKPFSLPKKKHIPKKKRNKKKFTI